ncbi:Pycsar system effector family protein [Streptomyces sp. NPDC127098]|uniref:Pycsar system effector family protein n=1 Tax=Streptomyces sp. NPDC127098 TaxID=3347137 RepID=UPI003662FABE
MPAPDPPRPTRRPFPEALAERLLGEIRVEINRADSKASVLVAGLGVAVALFGGAAAGGDWSPGSLAPAGRILWWLGAVACVASLAALLLAVTPRYGGPRWSPGDPLTYFGDIDRARGTGRLREALETTAETAELRLLHALTVNSHIAAIKLRWVRVGLATFATGATALATALLVG